MAGFEITLIIVSKFMKAVPSIVRLTVITFEIVCVVRMLKSPSASSCVCY